MFAKLTLLATAFSLVIVTRLAFLPCMKSLPHVPEWMGAIWFWPWPGRRPVNRALESMKNRLKVLRAERDWSQQDLADALGVSRQSVNAIETGKYDPSLPLAFRIADLFTMPIEAIFVRD